MSALRVLKQKKALAKSYRCCKRKGWNMTKFRFVLLLRTFFSVLVLEHALSQFVNTNVCRYAPWYQLLLLCQNEWLNIMRLSSEHRQVNPLIGLSVKLNTENSWVYPSRINNSVGHIEFDLSYVSFQVSKLFNQRAVTCIPNRQVTLRVTCNYAVVEETNRPY